MDQDRQDRPARSRANEVFNEPLHLHRHADVNSLSNPELIQGLGDENCSVAIQAAQTLGNRKAEEAIPALVRYVEKWSGDFMAVQTGMEALGRFGERGGAVVEAAVGIFDRSEEPIFKYMTAKALAEIGTVDAMNALGERLLSENEATRDAVLEAIKSVDFSEKPNVDLLVENLQRAYELYGKQAAPDGIRGAAARIGWDVDKEQFYNRPGFDWRRNGEPYRARHENGFLLTHLDGALSGRESDAHLGEMQGEAGSPKPPGLTGRLLRQWYGDDFERTFGPEGRGSLAQTLVRAWFGPYYEESLGVGQHTSEHPERG